ncbi:MAG: hypothetical protein QNI84_11675 [Henriciella sp.]|nr:hypothetical protein [Henriciella sp.]
MYRRISNPKLSHLLLMLMGTQAMIAALPDQAVWPVITVNCLALIILFAMSRRTEKKLRDAEAFAQTVI